MRKFILTIVIAIVALSVYGQKQDVFAKNYNSTTLRAVSKNISGSHLLFINPNTGWFYSTDSIPAWIIGGGGGSSFDSNYCYKYITLDTIKSCSTVTIPGGLNGKGNIFWDSPVVVADSCIAIFGGNAGASHSFSYNYGSAGFNSIAFNPNSQANSMYSYAMNYSVTLGDYSYAFGGNLALGEIATTQVTAPASFSFLGNTQSPHSIAIGRSSQTGVGADDAVALGAFSQANGANSFAGGGGISIGAYSFSYAGATSGNYSGSFYGTTFADSSFAIMGAASDVGTFAFRGSASGYHNISLGGTAGGTNSLAAMTGNTQGNYSTAIGANQNNISIAYSDYSMALNGGVTNGIGSFAFNSVSDGGNSFSFGSGCVTSGMNTWCDGAANNITISGANTRIAGGQLNYINNLNFGAILSGNADSIDGGNHNWIIGGYKNRLIAADSSIIISSTSSLISSGGIGNSILGGFNQIIQQSNRSVIISGKNNLIQGSSENSGILLSSDCSIDQSTNSAIIATPNKTVLGAKNTLFTTNQQIDSAVYLKNTQTITPDTSYKQVYRKNSTGELFIATSSSPAPANMIYVTKNQADSLITAKALSTGSFYQISGVQPTLYDDGTHQGTTIILQAAADSVFTANGTGIFYNPIIDKNIADWGIWSNRILFTEGTPVGVFLYNEQVKNNLGDTGSIIGNLSSGMIKPVNNSNASWLGATSITGLSSGTFCSISSVSESANYSVGSIAIWGGYCWIKTGGNTTNNINILLLDTLNWVKIPYSDSVYYNKAYDMITYDYKNDWISSRREANSNNLVEYTYSDYLNNAPSLPAISVFQWGNEYDPALGQGFAENTIRSSYVELVNFAPGSVVWNSFDNLSTFSDNVFSDGTSILANNFSRCVFTSNVLAKYGTLQFVYFSNGGFAGSTISGVGLSNSSLSNGAVVSADFNISSLPGGTVNNIDIRLGGSITLTQNFLSSVGTVMSSATSKQIIGDNSTGQNVMFYYVGFGQSTVDLSTGLSSGLAVKTISLNNNGTLSLPSGSYGTIISSSAGSVTAGAYLYTSNTDGSVTLVSNTANVSSTDAGVNLVIYNAAGTTKLKNRLGSAQTFKLDVKY